MPKFLIPDPDNTWDEKEIVAPDLLCPVCGKPMKLKVNTEQFGHGMADDVYTYECEDCLLMFRKASIFGEIKDEYDFYLRIQKILEKKGK